MSATAAPNFRPPHAVTMWCDDTRIFVELPAKEGPPYIIDFPLTEAGLSRAVNILKVEKKKVGASGKYKAEPDPRIKRKVETHNEETREKARAILKKMGLT